MDESKRALRIAATSRRDSLLSADRLALSQSIQARVLESSWYFKSSAIALYSAVQNEVCTDDIRDHALRHGKRLFYPRLTENHAGDFVLVQSIDDMIAGPFGFPEPSGKEILSGPIEHGLLIFVPGIAFDREGNRLGRGRGWYDRMLRCIDGNAIAIGLAYEFQLFDRVPVEPWDQSVRYIITENGIIDCEEIGPRALPARKIL
jgi:5-formyltetrahydrofolate cyclo-ligase